jgi:hypothetical protein
MSGQHPTPWLDAGKRVTIDGQAGTVQGLLRPGLVLWHVRMDDGRHVSVAPWIAKPLEAVHQ